MTLKSRERVFQILLLLIPFLLLFVLEAGLRVAGYAAERRAAFKPIENEPGWTGFNPEYASRYFRGFLPALAFNPFREDRVAGSIRVVALGGSSTAGFPYQWYHGFPAALERHLTDAYPGRPVEVINLGMTAVNSYTLQDLTRHVERIRPDLVVIYAGHNEFYGALGAGTTPDAQPKGAWFGRTWLTLKRSALVLALEHLLVGPPDYGLDAKSNERTMMARVVQNATIEKDGSVYQAGIEQFRSNMDRVLDGLTSAGIPVVAGTLVSNLTGQHPLSRSPDAEEAFLRGQRLMEESNLEEALNAFEQARDLDQIRFRASSDINTIIRSWDTRPGVTVVDLEPVFREASTEGIPGYDLFTDHLHPTQEGYELMGAAFLPSALRALTEVVAQPESSRLDWNDPSLLDGFSQSHAGILIDRLLSDYPFNLEATPDSTSASYGRQLRARRDSGFLGDSLAVAVMTAGVPHQNALLDGARIEMARGDTLSALVYYHSLFYWQPFNDALMEEIIAMVLSTPGQDRMLEKLALQAASRSDRSYFWNALAVTQLRQEHWDEAASALAQAERLEPDSPTMLYNRARLELARGDSTKARATLQQYRQVTSN
jgi:lysophospholipase L1-like esterase